MLTVHDGMRAYHAIEFCIGEDLPQGEDPLDRILASVFDAARFDVAVIDFGRGLLHRVQWPQVILSPPDPAGAAALRKAALKGFALVVAVKVESDAFERLVRPMRYEVVGTDVLGGGGKCDPFTAGWNKDALWGLLRVAARLSTHPVVLFGHDADPIWFLHVAKAQGCEE